MRKSRRKIYRITLKHEDYTRMYWGTLLILLSMAVFFLFGLPLVNKVMGVTTQLDVVPTIQLNQEN